MPAQADSVLEALPCTLSWSPEKLREMEPGELDDLA